MQGVSSRTFQSHGRLKLREIDFCRLSSDKIASPIREKGWILSFTRRMDGIFSGVPRSVRIDGSRREAQALTSQPLPSSQVVKELGP